MAQPSNVLEYKCPCCGAGLVIGDETQKMTCQYCDNEFDLETVKAFNESMDQTDTEEYTREESTTQEWSQQEQESLHSFLCPSCAGEILTDANTAATFCPYCGNPSIIPGRVSGGLRPDGVIPFKTSKEDAKAAFLNLCRNKPLLPKMFTQEQQLEKITGIYVPFWLYDCGGDFHGQYNATRVRHWSDRDFNYTKTDYFLLTREADAAFAGIPMDGSSKMDDTFMESIEPFDYGAIVDFDTAYLSGYLADKYDVTADKGEERIRQRVGRSMEDMLQNTFIGYSSVISTSRQLQVRQQGAKYVLLPVWILNTSYNGKTYTFAMNGQTGKMTGELPICPKRSAAWFGGIAGAAAVLAYIIQLILL